MPFHNSGLFIQFCHSDLGMQFDHSTHMISFCHRSLIMPFCKVLFLIKRWFDFLFLWRRSSKIIITTMVVCRSLPWQSSQLLAASVMAYCHWDWMVTFHFEMSEMSIPNLRSSGYDPLCAGEYVTPFFWFSLFKDGRTHPLIEMPYRDKKRWVCERTDWRLALTLELR